MSVNSNSNAVPQTLLGKDFAEIGIPALVDRLSSLNSDDKLLLLGWCQSSSTATAFILDEKKRVGLVKVLVSLLPESFPLLKEILERSISLCDYELHFSLFCFLDEAPQWQDRDSILNLVSDYLDKVSQETARAAWMAGDLLGDHWPLGQSAPALLEKAEHARHSAGREGAIHGLSCLLGRLERHRPEFFKIVEVLRRIRDNESTRSTGDAAAIALLRNGQR